MHTKQSSSPDITTGLVFYLSLENLLTSAVIPVDSAKIVVLLIAISSIVLTYWGQNVYRNSAVSNFGTAFFVNLALVNITKLFTDDTNSNVSFNTLTGISLLQFTGLVFYKLASIVKQNKRLMDFLKTKCQRKEAENHSELSEMAAAEREDEDENVTSTTSPTD